MLLLLFCFTLPVIFGESNNVHVLVGDDTTPTPSLYPSCFMEGLTWSSEESIDIIISVESLYSCQKLCLESTGCDSFSWHTEQSIYQKYLCFLFQNPTTQYPCIDCLSGPQSCTCSGIFSCQFSDGNHIGEVFDVEREVFCQEICAKTDGCTFYSWFAQDFHPFPKSCFLFSSCDKKDFSLDNCVSGPPDCTDVEIMTSTTTTTTSITPTTSTPPTTTTSIPTTTTTTTTIHPYSTCFFSDVTYPDTDIIIPFLSTDNAYTCQHHCMNTTRCSHFTWYVVNHVCLLFDHPTTTNEDLSLDFWSGPKSCTCSYHGSCILDGNNLIDSAEDMMEEDWCRELCYQNFYCKRYSWFDMTTPIPKQTCYLFSECHEIDQTCDSCYTGPPLCCELPKPPQHGEWFCPQVADPAICYLECYPGYLPEGQVVISCIDGSWTSSPRCNQAIGLITGSFSPPFHKVEVYGEGVHKHLPNIPHHLPRYSHTLDYVDSTVLLCGGGLTTRSCIKLTDSQQWISHSTTTTSRESHGSVVMLNQLHLLGGEGSPTSTEFLDPSTGSTWTQGWNLIEDTSAGCSTKMGPQTLITTGGANHPSASISYNVSSGAATRLMDLITPRENHGCAYVRDPLTKYTGVIVAGGYGEGFLSDSEIFNIEEGKWSKTGQLTSKRYGVCLDVLGESILAFGGKDESSLSTVDIFNLTSMDWSATESMLEARYHHAVTGVPPSLVTSN